MQFLRRLGLRSRAWVALFFLKKFKKIQPIISSSSAHDLAQQLKSSLIFSRHCMRWLPTPRVGKLRLHDAIS
jgi:hypothetical protein